VYQPRPIATFVGRSFSLRRPRLRKSCQPADWNISKPSGVLMRTFGRSSFRPSVLGKFDARVFPNAVKYHSQCKTMHLLPPSLRTNHPPLSWPAR
jgi:hypothetical protein